MITIPSFRGKVSYNYPLAQHTTWRIGGNAEVFAVPADLDDLLRLLGEAKRTSIPVFVLGQGSNVLIDDAGLRAAMGARGREIAVTKYDAGAVARSVLALTGLERTG